MRLALRQREAAHSDEGLTLHASAHKSSVFIFFRLLFRNFGRPRKDPGEEVEVFVSL